MGLDEEAAPIAGARDLLEPSLTRSRRLQHLLQEFLRSYGYEAVDVPVLERTSLYLRKLGSRVAASMFNLSDQNGESLSLRPEMTASAIRSYIRYRPLLTLPVRWQYCGPVFRDADGARGPLRQFTQLGAELIGSDSRWADGELIAVACKGLSRAGVSGLRLVLGHAGLLPGLLQAMPLSDRAKTYLVGHMDLLREGQAGVESLRSGLAQLQVVPANAPAAPLPAPDDAEPDGAMNMVGWLLSQGTAHSTGRRSTEQIVRRFRSKLQGADAPDQIDRALALAADLAAIGSTPKDALARGRETVERYGLRSGPLQELETVVGCLDAYDFADVAVEVDLGLTRALGYYTGIVFELFAGDAGDGPLGGGGRYDGLVRSLGGPEETPALGFAYTLERVEQALAPDALAPVRAASGVLVAPREERDLAGAVRYAEGLRARGEVATLEAAPASEEARRRYCRQQGIGRIAIVSGEGVREVVVGEESSAPISAS